MRQAIEERFILDVLANYTTYTAYWRLLKKIADDPRYDKQKAAYLLKSFVDLHAHAISEKVRIMVDHFTAQVQSGIGGRAKAMIVTRSRLHAVRYKLAVDRCLAERGLSFRALVAFSGTVHDIGGPYTEARMNGFPETQTACRPGGAAARSAAEHRHGVVPPATDGERQNRARSTARYARSSRDEGEPSVGTRGIGNTLAHHCRAQRALRAPARPRAPRHPRPDDGEAR